MGWMEDISKVRDVLERHKDKNFVQRVLEPERFPVVPLEGGDVATHKMAWATSTDQSGKKVYRVFPTILFEDGQLIDYGDDAYERAVEIGEYIDFAKAKDADWFSKHYKDVWSR